MYVYCCWQSINMALVNQGVLVWFVIYGSEYPCSIWIDIYRIGIRWLLICIAIFSANILYGLDATIAADIQAAVSETFDNVTQLGWLGVGFTLGSTVSILPLGKAFGIFDTKWIFLGCLTMFAAGSALCGASQSMNAIIVGRVWAGAGGAGMYLGYV